jgi:hypothetical protein
MNYEDGIWDLLLGLIFMMLAVYPVTRARLGVTTNFSLFMGTLIVVVLAQHFLRRQVSTPRVGYVKPRRSRTTKLILAVTIVLLALTCGLVVLTLVGSGSAPEQSAGAVSHSDASRVWARSYLVEIVVMLALAGLFSVMGYVFGVIRLYFYGWLLGGGNLISVMVNRGAPERFNLPLAVAAAVILVIGSALLVRFLHKYPVRSLEA